MNLVPLVPHPDSAATPEVALAVQAHLARADMLMLRYVLSGALQRLHVPEEAAAVRTAELWRQTCFEAFVQIDGTPGYLELNFSPSLAWQAYRFSARREGRAAAELPAPPNLTVGHRERAIPGAGDDAVVLEALVRLPLAYAQARRPLRLGLSAVVEDDGGTLSYWALRHAPGRPDFHHPDAFALTLEPGVRVVRPAAATDAS